MSEPNEEELVGKPTENVPQREPGEYCNARKSSNGIFEGYCQQIAGNRTEHQGRGRCWLHGGNSPRGEDSPQFKHGLFSDYLSEDDREEMEAIEARGNIENLQEMINYEFMRLRRAVRNIEEDADDRSFWDAYNEIIEEASASGLGQEEIASLADLLDANYSAFNHRVEELRKLVKTFEELTEGKTVNIDGDVSHTHAGEEGGAPIRIEWQSSKAEEGAGNDGE